MGHRHREDHRAGGQAATLKPDRATIAGDGHDLSFVTLTVVDQDGLMVPRAKNPIHFSITGPGEIVATDNGDATDLSPSKPPIARPSTAWPWPS